jgi:predicted transcriptional regulator
LSKLELQIMDALWTRGALSVREIQEAFAEKNRPAYTTVQTMVYRLEAKAIRRVKKIGNAHIFEAAVARASAQRRFDRRVAGVLRRPLAAGDGALSSKPAS